MHLERIILTNFRNYEKGEVGFCPGLNCLTGRNGMGKTNLLDAVHYLCIGKSSMNALDRYVMRQGADFMRMEGLFERQGRQERIVVKLPKGKAKVMERNGVAYAKFSEHVGLLPVVIILPDDTDLIKDGSEARRRFMDNTLSQTNPDYLERLIRYNKLLRQRNALLKQSDGHLDYQLLATYDEQMTAPAHYIHDARRTFMEAFEPCFKTWYAGISMASEEVGLAYRSQLSEEGYPEVVKRNAQRDAIMQRSHSGVHKDDLVFRLSGQAMKRFASQGQMKSFILSLGLARFEWVGKYQNSTPILLLDDIFDKLDRSRITQLLSLLSDKEFGQIFLTDTHLDRVREVMAYFKREARIFEVNGEGAHPIQ